MFATDSDRTSMEDSHAIQDEEGSLTITPSSVPPAMSPSSTPLVQTTIGPNFPSETMIETKAVSMASNDCSLSLSSPAEASPAKPAVTSTDTFDRAVGTSPATSHIESASDALTRTETSLVSVSESSPLQLQHTTFGSGDQETDFPAVLTFKGITVSLENDGVWKQFHRCGTEMILTKHGRRMFPYCRYRLAGLDPKRHYSLVLSIVPSDQYRYRWGASKWEVSGPAENQTQGLIRAFAHYNSPCRGSEWMNGLVLFYKLKLTNHSQDQEGHIPLHSMHRYIPRLHVIPSPDEASPTAKKPVVMGSESITFTFPQTEFMAVTTYQNFRITQLKINHNPFAKGFREDGHNSRLNRVATLTQHMVKTDDRPSPVEPAELEDNKEGVVGLSTKKESVPAPLFIEKEHRIVLKPIMSSSSRRDRPYIPCLRGKHALGDLVLVHKRPRVESNQETNAQQEFTGTPRDTSATPTSTASTPRSSPGYRKRKKRINRHWASSRGRVWKGTNASTAAVQSPPLIVAMQPEMDDVEGLLFVSFSSKEALEVHVGDKPANKPSSVPPDSPTTQIQLNQKVEVIPDTDDEKIACFEVNLLQDLHVLKHRQVIHPVLQQVGLKLNSLDATKSIDLQYLGVLLPLPPPKIPEKSSATSPGDEALHFISRTGKTSDVTQIKGWKNKFIRNKETSPSNCDGPQKNLSAFCSNMLDEYLESEGRYISERAAAFSTNPEGPVAYQLPAKSSSYVKTLDSVLKHNAASKVQLGVNRPCPLSHKPSSYTAMTSADPSQAKPQNPIQAEARSKQESTSSCMLPEAASVENAAPASKSISSVSQRLSTHHTGVSQKSTGMPQRPSGFTKFQLKLLVMENGALNEGLLKTQLTPERLKVALSVILTKEMLPSQFLKVPKYTKNNPEEPACGLEFCRLGCVCSSIKHPNRRPLHCRRPECMFGCTCFKRKLTKLLNTAEKEEEIKPAYSVANMATQPHPGLHADKLWTCKIDDVDPDPLFAPERAPLCPVPAKTGKSSSSSKYHSTPPIREEDKDPVYRYLESMMTCARVREINSKPPEVILEPKIIDNSTPDTKTVKTAADSLPKMYYRTLVTQKTDQSSLVTTPNLEARKQIEIQSACQWDGDRKKVLENLFRRLRQNRLNRRFYVGPYRINPVSRIFMRKPSGSIVTYRVHLSKPSQASDNDEDDFEDSDEEKPLSKSPDGDFDAAEEIGLVGDPVTSIGVIPFLGGVQPGGKLTANIKPVRGHTFGHIQVNGKGYNHARLLLGNIGALHPANRLAAYVTCRLHAPPNFSHSTSQKFDPSSKINNPGIPQMKAADTLVPSSAGKTAELKTTIEPTVQLSQTDSWRKGGLTIVQPSQSSSTTIPFDSVVSGQRKPVSSFQNTPPTSHVSLTVSPSLKSPSFLDESGTYSFRICPPAHQDTKSQNPPGVILPGGFTLIQLPNRSAAKQDESTINTAPPPKGERCNVGNFAVDKDEQLNSFTRVKSPLSSTSAGPGSSSGLRKTTWDENRALYKDEEANIRYLDANMDLTPEDVRSDSSGSLGSSPSPRSSDLSDSDSSEYSGGEEDEFVDVETVDEEAQGMAMNEKRKDFIKSIKSEHFGYAEECNKIPINIKETTSLMDRRRAVHTVDERHRRSEQRELFDKLQSVLQNYPKSSRLRLLTLAQNEIKMQEVNAKYLKEQKRKLNQIQSLYIDKLSHLSGKSDTVIKLRLKEVFDRQKMREKMKKWTPFYSHLLQSRAALLQDSNPQVHSMSMLENDYLMSPFRPYTHSAAAEEDGYQTPTPHSLPLAVPPPAQANVTVPSLLTENRSGEPGDQAQFSMSNSQTDCPSQAPSITPKPQVPKAQDKDSPQSKTAKSATTLTLPLVRSKNGRLILPSTVKPAGLGFYTLKVMDREPKRRNGDVDMQPSDVDGDKNPVKSDQPTESNRVSEDKTVTSSTSAPKQKIPPLAQLVHLNKSILVPLTLQGTDNNEEGAAAGMENTVCLSFNSTLNIPICVEPKKDGSHVVVRRGRGRPRKYPKNEKKTVAKARTPNKKSVTTVSLDDTQNERINVEAVDDKPVPVKRGRGRPPKKKQALCRHVDITAQGSSPKSYKDNPDRLSSSFKSPGTERKERGTKTSSLGERNTSRPLTRGSLGKDFPSEKRRSWIDLEKELEPDFEYE